MEKHGLVFGIVKGVERPGGGEIVLKENKSETAAEEGLKEVTGKYDEMEEEHLRTELRERNKATRAKLTRIVEALDQAREGRARERSSLKREKREQEEEEEEGRAVEEMSEKKLREVLVAG